MWDAARNGVSCPSAHMLKTQPTSSCQLRDARCGYLLRPPLHTLHPSTNGSSTAGECKVRVQDQVLPHSFLSQKTSARKDSFRRA